MTSPLQPADCADGRRRAAGPDLHRGLLSGQTVIGIHDSELHRPQPLVIDLYAGRAALARLRHRPHRGHHRLRRGARAPALGCCVEHRIQLLEAFAEAIAAILIDEFGARWARVKVIKPHKFDDVAVGRRADRTFCCRRRNRCPSCTTRGRRAAPDRYRHGAGDTPPTKTGCLLPASPATGAWPRTRSAVRLRHHWPGTGARPSPSWRPLRRRSATRSPRA